MFRLAAITATTAACVMALSAAILAQQATARDKLAKAKSIKCDFPSMSTVEWDKASGRADAALKPSTLTMRFDMIDIDQGTARVIGPFGPSEIIVRNSGGTLHLLQSFNEGPLYATTVFPDVVGDGRFKAVHTRHEFTQVSLPGFTSRPEQYYGACLVDQ